MITPNLSLIRSAQSVAPIQAPQVVPASVSQRQPPTQDYAIDHSVSSGNDWLLQYPIDRPKYFMVFDIYDYTRTDLLTVGEMQRVTGVNTIVMPLTESLTNMTQAIYDSHVQIGPIAGVAAGYAAPGLKSIVAGQGGLDGRTLTAGGIVAATALTGALSNALTSAAPAAGRAGSGLVDGLLDPAKAILGFTPNQFFTVLFVGPEYKRHKFQWQVSPRNFEEANTLRKINKTFNNRMSPRLGLGGLIWKFPKIFWISLYTNSKFTMKFKPAVLEAFSVNYTPGGRSAFYRSAEDPVTGNNPPEGMIINAQFLELEYWVDGNFNDSNDPHDSYTKEP